MAYPRQNENRPLAGKQRSRIRALRLVHLKHRLEAAALGYGYCDEVNACLRLVRLNAGFVVMRVIEQFG